LSGTKINIAVGECKKATQILESFLTPSSLGNPGKELPAKVLANAKVIIPLLAINLFQ
jgi:hypothetical protein